MKFDYLIVGSGLFGSVFAYEAKLNNKSCLVIDKRNHIGGNVYCENIEGINVHKYGAHIFHTNDKQLWNYVNRFVEFNNFINSPLALSSGKLYNLPFNMNTFYQLWGVIKPDEAKSIIIEQVLKHKVKEPKNLEEQALSIVGTDIYYTLIKEYTEKQWGRRAMDLPASIIKRIPLRFTFDNNYFNDSFQGIPVGGYNKLISSLLDGTEVLLGTDFFKKRNYLSELAEVIIYTGRIDEYYNYKYGKLKYRSLKFINEVRDTNNFQGNAVINYSDNSVPYTRIIEHKHFEFGKQDKTVLTYEHPLETTEDIEPFYPINDSLNTEIYKKYAELAKRETKVVFGGRLAEYRYYDMHQVIASSLSLVKRIFGTNSAV